MQDHVGMGRAEATLARALGACVPGCIAFWVMSHTLLAGMSWGQGQQGFQQQGWSQSGGEGYMGNQNFKRARY